MTWYEKIIAAHTAVTDAVSHAGRIQSDRYFVWQEESKRSLAADNRHAEQAVSGSTDLFTKIEFDPWVEAFEKSLEDAPDIMWEFNSVQFEEKTGFWHYEWLWTVM